MRALVVLGAIMSAGPAGVATDDVEVCRVVVAGEVDPLPDGIEPYVEVSCAGYKRVTFDKVVANGNLELTFTAPEKTRAELEVEPLRCEVGGEIFQKPATFECPEDPDDAPTLALKDAKCRLLPRYAGDGRHSPIFVDVNGDKHALDANGTYTLNGNELSALYNGRLEVKVLTRDQQGDLQSTFVLGDGTCTPDGSRSKDVHLVVERCDASTPVTYNLTALFRDTNQLLKVTTGSLKPVVVAPFPLHDRPVPPVALSSGVLEVRWPANNLCMHAPGGAQVRLRVDLPDRRLLLGRNGSIEEQSLPPSSRRGIGARSGARRHVLRLEGALPTDQVVVARRGRDKRVAASTDGAFRFTSDSAPRLLSLTRALGTCRDEDDARVCSIVERHDHTLQVWLHGAPMKAPFGVDMQVQLMAGGLIETARGADRVVFIPDAVPRIERGPPTTWRARLTVPGYLWRDARGDIETRLGIRIGLDDLARGQVELEPRERRLRDPVYWALRARGWSPGPTWLAAHQLGAHDPVAVVSALFPDLLEGSAAWADYENQIKLLAAIRGSPEMFRDHLAAAAMLLRAHTIKRGAAPLYRHACERATTARAKSPPSAPDDIGVDDLDLALVEMEGCLCAGTMVRSDVEGMLRDLGPHAEQHPEYKEQYVRLRIALDRGTHELCNARRR